VVLGYVISGPDNGTHMFAGDAQPPRCDGCGVVTDFTWVDPAHSVPSNTPDVSFTYDGRLIVSDAFRAIARRYAGAKFTPLAAAGFWLLTADAPVAFDAVRRKTQFSDFCESCRRFTVVAGATPAFLVDPNPLLNHFVRTDVEFGSRDELHPLVLVGPTLGDVLAEAGLTGLYLTPISDEQ
jgi:hypothetical protein